jgi:hypothetical protein
VIYVSLSSYLAGRLLGPERGAAELNAILGAASGNDSQWFPALRTLRRLRQLTDMELRLDTGATCIGKSRSRHFTAAVDSKCTAWLTIDDDVEASLETLGWLLAAVDDDEPRICIAPCLLRDGKTANVEWTELYSVRRVDHAMFPHGQARRARRGGFGLVAMNRGALDRIAANNPRTWRDDNDGEMKWWVFAETQVVGRASELRWLGEDLSFFETAVPSGVVIEALSTGETMHAGYGLDFGELK